MINFSSCIKAAVTILRFFKAHLVILNCLGWTCRYGKIQAKSCGSSFVQKIGDSWMSMQWCQNWRPSQRIQNSIIYNIYMEEAESSNNTASKWRGETWLKVEPCFQTASSGKSIASLVQRYSISTWWGCHQQSDAWIEICRVSKTLHLWLQIWILNYLGYVIMAMISKQYSILKCLNQFYIGIFQVCSFIWPSGLET